MKDGVLLLLAGAACAVAAWAFWHYLGADALSVLVLLVLASVVSDNMRLRRKLRRLRGGD